MKQYLQIGFVVVLVILGMGNLPARDGNPSVKKDVGKVRLIRLHYENTSGEKGVTTFEYDQNRKLIKKSFICTDGSTGSESYQYDDNGRLNHGVYDNVDSWLTRTITFDYHPNGNLLKRHFKGKKGVNAEISYTHDENKNLVAVHWIFSFGETQTYHFEYKKMEVHFMKKKLKH